MSASGDPARWTSGRSGSRGSESSLIPAALFVTIGVSRSSLSGEINGTWGPGGRLWGLERGVSHRATLIFLIAWRSRPGARRDRAVASRAGGCARDAGGTHLSDSVMIAKAQTRKTCSPQRWGFIATHAWRGGIGGHAWKAGRRIFSHTAWSAQCVPLLIRSTGGHRHGRGDDAYNRRRAVSTHSRMDPGVV